MTTRNLTAPAQLGLAVTDDAPDDDGYRCFVVDPPWLEKGGSRGADKHYPLLPTADIPRVVTRAEIFARRPRDGWSVWGNEVAA